MLENRKNVWSTACGLNDEFESHIPRKPSILFIGNRSSGKTSLIHRFIESRLELRETLALQYYTASKIKKYESFAELCDIWELGEGSVLTELLGLPIRADNLSNLMIVLSLDLSRPEEIIIVSDVLLKTIQKRMDGLLKNLSTEVLKELDDQTKTRLRKNRSSSSGIFTVPLIIVGTKFDLFQEMDSEERKLINRYLRCLTASLGACMIYTSSKRDVLMNKFSSLLFSLAFKVEMDKIEPRIDHRKPLWIPFDADTLEDVGDDSIDTLRKVIENRWPQIEIKKSARDNPADDDNFREHDIDLIYSQRGAELRKFHHGSRQQAERIYG
ncbi:cytoplasmic dynein 2 light intermediate chain 1 [Brevipalpus obovatus]|uniref:cytoplasmic dynein 2 light intermediate chain 1 n=1 Tax=Brevipalpus obovatus TaxID=246614 RepID=UPI003D9E9796